jgi:hypothetical protein
MRARRKPDDTTVQGIFPEIASLSLEMRVSENTMNNRKKDKVNEQGEDA